MADARVVLFPEMRPESFWVGHGEFDPFAVGVDITKGEAICGAPEPPCHVLQDDDDGARPGTDDAATAAAVTPAPATTGARTSRRRSARLSNT